jgi:N-ethylmaleimide reductase
MLFDPTSISGLSLQNRVVMAPMTRSRAEAGAVPSALVATYYEQRASAGLIVTEGTSPSPNGLGYARIPGLYSEAQVSGWRKVTDAVHARGGKIFVQLMHTGRVTSRHNLPEGAQVVGPSSDALPGTIWTDGAGMQPHDAPHALTTDEVRSVVDEYVRAGTLALEAGFDGVEIHGANGYLVEQFLNANVNQRTDAYGGSAEARNRFALEVADGLLTAIGAARVGIRLSPHGVFNGTGAYEGVDEQYVTLARQLGARKLAYLHLVDHSSMGAPTLPATLAPALRAAFDGTFVLSGGYDAKRAEHDLREKRGDLVAFGRPFIANPDLVERMKTGAPLAAPDDKTFYTPGPAGYTDYPSLR